VSTPEGTPQGGPLPPLLSNVVLDELDQEFARRGYRFVRYADDTNVYVRSERAGDAERDPVHRRPAAAAEGEPGEAAWPGRRHDTLSASA
jgi:retron-type reverse transcriptase